MFPRAFLTAVLTTSLLVANPLVAETSVPKVEEPFDVGTIYRVEDHSATSDAFIFSCSSLGWNLLDPAKDEVIAGGALAGWRLFEDLPLSVSQNDEFRYRLRSKMKDVSEKLQRNDEASSAQAVYEGNNSTYSFLNVKDQERELYVGHMERRVEEKTSLSARLMMKSDQLGIDGEPPIDSRLLPSNAAQVGVATLVGRVRVWGEFQINDWNGIKEENGSSRGDTTARNDIAIAAATLKSEKNSSTGISRPTVSSSDDTMSFEVGASFPTENGVGAVHYRRSSDSTSAVNTVESEHLGLQGEVALKDDVRIKAGFERIYSTSGSYAQQEQNVWTGIEIHF